MFEMLVWVNYVTKSFLNLTLSEEDPDLVASRRVLL